MPILDTPRQPENHVQLREADQDKVAKDGLDLMNNAPTRRWRSIFQKVKDDTLATEKLPGEFTVIYESPEPEVSSITGSRVRKNAYRYMVPGYWELKSQKVVKDGVFVRSELLAKYIANPMHSEDEIVCLPARRGRMPK